MKEIGEYVLRGALCLAGAYFVLDIISLVLVWIPSGGAACYRYLHVATDPVVSALVGSLRVGWIKFFCYEFLTLILYALAGGVAGWVWGGIAKRT